IERLAADGTQLITTVDCGIASVDEAATARRLGIQLIITDHHEMAAQLPDADVLVHPRLPGSDYPFHGLSGSGVAFKVAWALCQQVAGAQRVGERMKRFLLEAIGLAAIGTVADVVPLVDENRILVRHGLTSLREYGTLGINALAKVTKVDQKPTLASEDIAFMLAPRLNAAGRLGQAQLAVELMTTSDPSRAETLADYINQLNGTRESLDRSIYLAANRQAQEQFNPQDDAALVLAGHGWHPGVIGIVAGRLAEKYHRPVVLIALDELGVKPGVGSARSVPGFDLHKALQVCSANLLAHGGHAAAAGLKIAEGEVEGFRAAFCEYAAEMLTEAHRVAELWIDGETSLSALSLKTVRQIEQLAPFGQGNARPVLCASDVTVSTPPKRIGGGGRHLALSFSQHGTTFRSVAFGGGDWADQLAEATAPLEIAFRPTINHFRGRQSVELHLADWRMAESVSDEDVS
ncbi:MAG: single-stranded-DNA-specific exonuclease RecJ, partial [Pirellulales bacterium]